MQFSTKEKTYGYSQQTGSSGAENLAGNLAVNSSYQAQNTYVVRTPDRREGGEVKRTNLIDTPKNEEILNSFPQLNINRVDSAEHREKLKVNPPPGTSYIGLTNSMIDRPVNRGDSRTTSTSVEKAGSNVYLNPRGDMYSSSQYGLNKPYATYKRDANMGVNYNYVEKSDDGSDNEVPSYKRTTKMTMERMDMEINPKMVSSVISRQSNGGKQSGSRNKDSRKSGDDESYEQLYASRHPNESIRKSTIEISKAISSNAITELQRVNENQKKQIKLLEKQLDDIKSSLKKYEQIKHRHQLDLEGKSRQIFDLERANKRLSEELQGIRSYRTMDTVEQVIIVRLKEQIMQLNKKIIQMQAEHYKNQKMFLEKHQKKDGSKPTTEPEIDKESIKKLQEAIIISKKETELLSAELQKQKEKSWSLQREKQQYIAKESIEKQSNERQFHSLKKQVTSLKSQLQKQTEALRLKDTSLDEKLKEQQKAFDIDLSKKLTQKDQEYKVRLNEEMRLYESKIVQQGKNDKVKYNEQKQQIDRLRRQKEQGESQLKQKIAEIEQNLQKANQKISQSNSVASSQLTGEIINLKKIIEQKQNQIRGRESERNKIIEDVKNREGEIDRLQKESAQWKQEQIVKIEKNIKAQLEQEITKKSKQLSDKNLIITSLQQNINQMKVKFEQEKQQQAVQLQAEIKQKEQKLQTQAKDKQQGAIKQLEATRTRLTGEVKKAESNLANISRELSNATSQKNKIEEIVSVKQRQLKEVEVKFVDIQSQIQARSAEIAQIDNQKKVLAAETQRMKEQSEKQKSVVKQYEAKLAATVSQLNTLRVEFAKIEQKSKQSEIELNRATENVNTWKSKNQNLQSTLDKERADFKVKIAEAEGSKVKVQIVKKYEQLLPQYEMLKERLKIKQQQILNREKEFSKIRHQTENEEGKVSGLMKQLKGLTTKVTETENKLRTILSKVEADENKYKELLDKFSTDSQVYLAFIKKLQEDNELIAQKYWKVRKLVKKQKITDEHELLEKHDYGTFKKYMEHQVMSHFKKVVIPAFEAKILQRISAHESNLLGKTKRLGQLRAMVQYSKKRRQAQIKG